MAQKGLFDRNTLIIFGVILLLALSVILFRWFTKPNCPEVKFSVASVEIKAGELVYFKDETPGAESWEWNFGDGDTVSHETKASASHIFQEPGEYTVTLSVNGCSEEFQKVTVNPAFIPTDTILPIAGISGPAECRVGQKVTYKDTTDIGTSWAWSFGETGTTDATEKVASYVFKQPGEHTVSLIVNGKSRAATMKVMVKPAPTGGGGKPVNKAPSIGEAEFIRKLNDIISNKERGAHIFDPYLCSYINMVIKVNGEDQVFSSYCQGLYVSGADYVKAIKRVKTVVDPTDGCITSIQIEQIVNTE